MGISLSHERYEKIKRIVVNMFVKYEVSCVPVNGFELATKMGIKIIPYSAILESKRYLLIKKSEDGFCVEKSIGEWYIYYNDEKDYGRINNTIMHEIGHIVLDHSEDSELAEKEVKFFAKYALAPPVLIHKFKLKNAVSIADVFEISYEAACYAYSYYRKWLQYGEPDFTDYETTMLKLFEDAV
ncbi:MAG: ImmA/IrrE family metallo-endopeptidase [Clostridia bacterium]|nr:ImmA/IrrE family metallo-endopeptidase [Clostridia bacterium]